MKNTFVFMALLPLFSWAGQIIDKQIEIPLLGKVVIETPRGTVEIRSWDKASFKVTGTLDDLAKGYKLETKGEKTQFIIDMPRKNWMNYSEGSNLIIYMPKKSELDFEGIDVDVTVSDLHATVKIKTVNGEINAAALNGKISLDTVNGDINTDNISGNLHFETVNGDIDDNYSNGKVRFFTVNGDIESRTSATDIRLENVSGKVNFVLASLSDLRLNTVDGEVEINVAKLNDNGRINIETVSGDVSLYFPANTSAKFNINAFAGGRIINELSQDKVMISKYGASRELDFSLNGENADIKIDTVSGRVALKKLDLM